MLKRYANVGLMDFRANRVNGSPSLVWCGMTISHFLVDIANFLAGEPADIRDISGSAAVSRVSYRFDTMLDQI